MVKDACSTKEQETRCWYISRVQKIAIHREIVLMLQFSNDVPASMWYVLEKS